MPIKRGIRIDPEKLGISKDPEGDRRRLLEQSQWNAQAKVGAMMSDRANDGATVARIGEKLKSRGLYLSMNDLMGVSSNGPMIDRRDAFQGIDTGGSGMLTEDFPTAHDNMLMEDDYAAYSAYEDVAPTLAAQSRRPTKQPAPQRQAPQAPQRQALREQIIGAPPQSRSAAMPKPPWGVRAFMGETKNGGQVPIWKVVNGKTGSSVNNLFRVEDVASRVAALLNESGDINDPRALNLIRIHDKREQLLKEARLLEKTADGKPMKTERLKTLYREIGQLDSRLGV